MRRKLGRTNNVSTKRNKRHRKVSEFSYLRQRKCLRMMRRYFKDKFESWGVFTDYKQQMRTLSAEGVDQAIKKFIELEFPYMIEYRSYSEYTQLDETLKTMILSDRYNKNEWITEGLDFEIVRKTLYSFNTRNLIEFFSQKCYALLFFHYYDEYGQVDARKQADMHADTLLSEMQELYREAEKYVKLTMDNFKRDVYDQPLMYNYDESYNPCLSIDY